MDEHPFPRGDEALHRGRRVDRRTFLLAGGAAAVIASCSSDSSDAGDTTATTTAPADAAAPVDTAADTGALGTTTPADLVSPFAVAEFESLGTCRLLREKAAGPFGIDEQFDRRDITEGYPGHPLRLGLRVVDAACAPVPGAVVEIWHTDATGDYSAFTDNGLGKDEGPGTTFLRGSQATDSDGIAEFMSLYPGWYPGRCVHIHVRVHLAGGATLTSQLFFDDAYTADVFTTGEYASNGPPDTVNAADGIAGDPAAEGTLLRLAPGDTTNGAGTVALLNLGVG